MAQFKNRAPPTYEELMIHIKYLSRIYISIAHSKYSHGSGHSYKLYKLGVELHEETRNYKRNRSVSPNTKKADWEGEMDNFQSPCVRLFFCSHFFTLLEDILLMDAL